MDCPQDHRGVNNLCNDMAVAVVVRRLMAVRRMFGDCANAQVSGEPELIFTTEGELGAAVLGIGAAQEHVENMAGKVVTGGFCLFGREVPARFQYRHQRQHTHFGRCCESASSSSQTGK